MPSKPDVNAVPISNNLRNIISQANAAIQSIQQFPFEPISDVIEPEGTIYTQCHANFCIKTFTHFTKSHIDNLYQIMEPHTAAHHRRAKQPKLSVMDSMLCLLLWFRTGSTIEKLAAELNLTSMMFLNAIDRVAPILLDTLKAKYWHNRIRPVQFLIRFTIMLD